MKRTVLLPLLLLALAAAAPAADLFSRDFASGAYDPAGLLLWTGPTQDAWGRIATGDVPESLRPPGQALVFRSNTAAPKNCAVTFSAKIPPSPSAEPKVRRFRIRFLVPIVGQYRVDLHFGGNWDSNAAILVLDSGFLNVWNPAKGFKAGPYEIEKWNDLLVEFDPAAKTYAVSLNGAALANGLPWNDPKLAAVNDFLIVGDIGRTTADDTPTLYLASLSVSED